MTHPSRRWTRRTAIAATTAAACACVGVARAEELPWQLPTLRRIRVHGHDIAYYEQGSGPALVLIHGASGSPALEFGRVFTPLSRKFRVIVPHLIGFGPSDQPDLPYDAATFVDYLGGFLGARSAADATLLGESLGGWVVAHYALRQGHGTAWGQPLPQISHLVVVDGAVQVRAGQRGGGPQDSINDPAVRKLAHDFYQTQPKVDDNKVKQVVGPHVVEQRVTDEQLKTIRVPTLVIWGREDELIPVDDGRHVATQIPGARSVIISDCGHIPSVEQPRAFLTAVDDFLGAN
jgi:pimeloyl-ACP methyl ester carboxylesterase